MTIIKTFLVFTFTIMAMIVLIPFGLLAFVFSLAGIKKSMSWAIYRMAQGWARVIILISGCKMTVEGRENIPKKGAVCFASNHVGILDIILALGYINRPFGFIAKKELAFLPFINMWIYILGGLFIDRKNIRKAIQTINSGIEKIQKGNAMLIFPEGTRSKGRGLLPFRSGAIKLATNSLAPIVPMAIYGSYEVFEKNYRVKAVPVRLVFCNPIETKDMSKEDRRSGLVEQVKLNIEEALAAGNSN